MRGNCPFKITPRISVRLILVAVVGVVTSLQSGLAQTATEQKRQIQATLASIEKTLIREWKETVEEGRIINASLYKTRSFPYLVRTEAVGSSPPSTMMGDQVIVEFTNAVEQAGLQKALGPSFSIRRIHPISRLCVIGFTGPAEKTSREALAQVRTLLSEFPLKSVYPDLLLTLPEIQKKSADGAALMMAPAAASDAQWALTKISALAPTGDALRTLLRAPVVAVVDTGVAFSHPALTNALWCNKAEISGTNGVDDDHNGYIDDFHGWDFLNNTNIITDISDISHGTRCASIIAAIPAADGKGMRGVSPNARILPLTCFGETGAFGLLSSVVEALAYARTMNADVINCSWIISSNEVPDIEPLRKEIEENLAKTDVILVAAAGDQNHDLDGALAYPACANSKNRITVLATDRMDFVNPDSNFGSLIQVGAPGVDVLSARYPATLDEALYSSLTGSSFAAAHVSGVAAFLKSALTNASADSIIKAIIAGADTTTNASTITWSKKRLNLSGALTASNSPNP